jgi:hypothetical protein
VEARVRAFIAVAPMFTFKTILPFEELDMLEKLALPLV